MKMVTTVGFAVAVIALAFSTIVVVLFQHFWQLGSLKRFPPGPRPWPFVGNLPLMKGKSLTELSKELFETYGPLITIWIGSNPIVIVSSPELIQSAFITQGFKLMGRARFESIQLLNNNRRGLTSTTGQRWKLMRRMVMLEVMSKARLVAFRPIRKRQIDDLVDRLRKPVREGQVTVLSEIQFAIFNMLIEIFFERTLDRQTFEIVHANLQERVKLAAGQPQDHLRFLRLFPNKNNIEHLKRLLASMYEIFNPLLEERRKIVSSCTGTENLVSYADKLIATQSQFQTDEANSLEGKEVLDITDRDIVHHVLELLIGGIDTTSVTLEYAFANLIINPNIQEKLFNEIDTVVGTDRLMNEDDFPNLPYLQAVVNETLRRHPPAHIMPSRTVTSPDCEIAGYNIPVDTLIAAHLESISSNPETWKNPSDFDPERFYSTGRNPDFTGTYGINMIPFGVGRRICPAINVAVLHIQLILGRLVHAFEWSSAIPGQLPDLTPAYGFLNPMKHPLQVILRDRQNS